MLSQIFQALRVLQTSIFQSSCSQLRRSKVAKHCSECQWNLRSLTIGTAGLVSQSLLLTKKDRKARSLAGLGGLAARACPGKDPGEGRHGSQHWPGDL
eukprot:65939-Pelagomonas_calceolata.AAC.3